MENHQILLLQLIVASFEGDAYCERLVQEADRLILDFAGTDQPDGKKLPESFTDDKDILAGLILEEQIPFYQSTNHNLPAKLAALAAMEPTSSCKGCGTPNPTKDEGNNCDICGYPGLI
jgi:hypothetical protein